MFKTAIYSIRILKLFKLILRKLLFIINNIDQKLETEFDLKAHDFLVKRGASKYDMFKADDEKYYAKQYCNIIYNELNDRNLLNSTTVHDLACGQGRLIQELLKKKNNFKSIIAVDFSQQALKKCQQYLTENFPAEDRVTLENEDILNYLSNMPDNSLEVVLLLEVLYMVDNPEKILRILSQKLKSSGVAFISLRSDYFSGLSIIRQNLLESTDMLLNKQSGFLFNSSVMFNWTNSKTIKKVFLKKFNLNPGEIFGIGTCSGIPGDPHEFICRPSKLGLSEVKNLLKLESLFGEKYPDTGRYLLFPVVSNTAQEVP